MWEAFKDLIFQIIQFFYNPIGDWGMAIVIVTIIFRIIIYPLTSKQTKSSFQMQKVQPLLQEIQAKYSDDPQRLQEETQKLYAEAHFNPLAGCLPMLLQMPIFIALFQVLREMGDRLSGQTYSFYHLVPNLVYSPSEALGQGFLAFLPYLILMLVFAFATFLPMVMQQSGDKDSPQRRQTLIMAGVMSIFMLFISWTSPAGVLLFWGVSSILAIVFQQVIMHRLRAKDEKEEQELEAKPVKIEVERKEKKKRPTKKH